MYPKGLHLAVTDAIGRSDAKIRAKLLKRWRKHGLTDQDVAALVEERKRATDEHEHNQWTPNSSTRVRQSVGLDLHVVPVRARADLLAHDVAAMRPAASRRAAAAPRGGRAARTV